MSHTERKLLEAIDEAVKRMDEWMLERTPTADDVDELRSLLKVAAATARRNLR